MSCARSDMSARATLIWNRAAATSSVAAWVGTSASLRSRKARGGHAELRVQLLAVRACVPVVDPADDLAVAEVAVWSAATAARRHTKCKYPPFGTATRSMVGISE